MKNKLILLMAILAVLICSNLAITQTTLPLNTGYNYVPNTRYPPVPVGPSTTRDDYWIVMNTFPTPNIPAYVIYPFPGWNGGIWPNSTSNWINAWGTYNSAPGVSNTFPGYAIFRKCFCLQPGFTNPKMNFRVRGDNTVSAWLNNTTLPNILVAPVSYPNEGSVNNRTTGFKVGPNCVYVLVEDYGTATGFDLVGDMQAFGLLPSAAKGPAQVPSFGQCSCPTGGPVPTDGPQIPSSTVMRQAADDEQKVVNEIIKIAEERRRQKMIPADKKQLMRN